MRRVLSFSLSAVLLLAAVSAANAQPKFIFTPGASDITADGNTTIGTILDANVDGKLARYTRGAGIQLLGPAFPSLDGRIQISNDGRYISGALYNGLFGPQNPAFGNYAPTVACCNGGACTLVEPAACTGTAIAGTGSCTPTTCPTSTDPATLGACCNLTGDICIISTRANCSSPNYWLGNWQTCGTNPCKHGHFVQHRFDAVTGTWTNGGSFPNVGGLGAAKCDGTINTPYDISSTGRFIVGGAWYGGYSATSCSLRGFIYDANDGSVKILPMVGTGCQAFSQGDRVSTDGNVVMGSDSHESPDPDGTSGPEPAICNARCLAVWERDQATGNFLASGRTILDDYGAGGVGGGTMNRSGTQIAAYLTGLTAQYVLGDGSKSGNLVKYVKNTTTGAWDRVDLGHCPTCTGRMQPYAISDDGNTIVGTAENGGAFIWRPSLNEGVPMSLSDYLTSLNGGIRFPATGGIGIGQSISADGNAIVGSWGSAGNNCSNGGGLSDLGRSGVLYLNGGNIPCDPPRIAGGPYTRAQEEYTTFGIVGNVFFSGSYPMTTQWQKEVPAGSGNWVNLSDSCGDFSADTSWLYEGTQGFQLRINMLAASADRDGNYRVVLTNPCGSATSETAQISVLSGACCYVPAGGSIPVCSVEMRTRCVGSTAISYFLGGTYLGHGTTCQPTTCTGVSGACCYGAGGPSAQCVVDVSPHCTLAVSSGGYGGTFVGEGTTCQPAACATVSGACCYSPSASQDVVCTVEISGQCTGPLPQNKLFGAFLGNGTTCGPTSCATVAGACCYSPGGAADVICTIQTQTRCSNPLPIPSNPNSGGLAGIWVGAGSTCLPLSQQCGFVAGACCHSLDDTSSAICTLQLQDRCTRNKNNSGLGGTYRGDGTTCTPTACATVTGACCYSTFDDPTNLICTIQPATRCTNRFNAGGLFGIYLGGGSTCGPTSCNASVGACCYTPPGSTCIVCSMQSQTRCTDPVNGGLGGTFAGIGVACSPLNCIRNEGACCVDTSCTVACQTICADSGGTYQGDGTTCSPVDPCVPNPTGACCRGTTCAAEIATACTGANSTFAGAGTICNTFAGNRTSPCCLADYNHVGGVTVQDIFDFLGGYFTQNPLADINGVGGVTVQDIFDYLSVYFGGC
jgi:hypothetical protein